MSRKNDGMDGWHSEAGFSLLEALVVAGIMMAMATAVVMQYRSAQVFLDADVALAQVTSQIRYARQIAIDQRRNVDIHFIGSAEIQIVRWDDATTFTTVAAVTLPSGYTFDMPTGAPDTPDGFGNDTPVDFGAATVTGGRFLGDGTFVDQSNAILNGTVFTMGATSESARVATLSGSTGRTKGYQWVNGSWVAQ